MGKHDLLALAAMASALKLMLTVCVGVMLGKVLLLWEAEMVSARGGKYGYVVRSRQNVYRALRRKGKSKKVAAMISNAGRTSGGRRGMARKGARTRRRRRRR